LWPVLGWTLPLPFTWGRKGESPNCRLRLKCDGTRAETRFRLSAKRTNPFKSAGASVQSTTGSRGVHISGDNAGYTTFRDSVRGTGYPLHSPVSPSLPLPYVTVCHHVSTGLYSRPLLSFCNLLGWHQLAPEGYFIPLHCIVSRFVLFLLTRLNLGTVTCRDVTHSNCFVHLKIFLPLRKTNDQLTMEQPSLLFKRIHVTPAPYKLSWYICWTPFIIYEWMTSCQEFRHSDKSIGGFDSWVTWGQVHTKYTQHTPRQDRLLNRVFQIDSCDGKRCNNSIHPSMVLQPLPVFGLPHKTPPFIPICSFTPPSPYPQQLSSISLNQIRPSSSWSSHWSHSMEVAV